MCHKKNKGNKVEVTALSTLFEGQVISAETFQKCTWADKS